MDFVKFLNWAWCLVCSYKINKKENRTQNVSVPTNVFNKLSYKVFVILIVNLGALNQLNCSL